MARERGSRWQADVRTPEGRLRPTFKTRQEAERWEEAALDAVVADRPIPQPATGMVGKTDIATLGPLFDHTCRAHWGEMRAANTLIQSGRDVVEHFGRNCPVETILPADIDDFAVSLGEKGRTQATVNRKLSALSKMLKIAHRNGVIDRLPEISWKKEMKTRFRYLDEKEERALLAYWQAVGDEEQHDLCIFLLDTGARTYTEAMPIEWDACGGRVATFWTTKANKPRSVPLTKRCREMLDRRRREKPGTRGPFIGAINKNTMRGRWDRMRHTLRLDDVTPHTLRHTCATRLVSGGADVKRVSEWLGHSNLVTTMRYLQMRPDALDDILHILERGRG